MRTRWLYSLFLFGLLLAACVSAEPEGVGISAETTPFDPEPTDVPQPTPTLISAEEVAVVATDTPEPTNEPEPTEMASSPAAHLPILGTAPNITNETWLNVDEPLTLEGLQGKVVLVEFWTFG